MDSASDNESPRGEVTKILRAVSDGAAERRGELFDHLYAELHALAGRHLRRERSDHTLQATALVHEAWLKLVDQDVVPTGGRSHFLSVASQAMRRILVDHARSKSRDKRGGGAQRVELETAHVSPTDDGLDLVALDDALVTLAAASERQARIVELRFFGGLAASEIADVLETSLSTVEREWRAARAWLLTRLRA